MVVWIFIRVFWLSHYLLMLLLIQKVQWWLFILVIDWLLSFQYLRREKIEHFLYEHARRRWLSVFRSHLLSRYNNEFLNLFRLENKGLVIRFRLS